MRKPNVISSYKPQRRLIDWDYASPGLYFVTICTHKRQWLFGKVINEQMHKNKMGVIAEEKWLSIPSHHSNDTLDEFVVMPNHIHGILHLTDSELQSDERGLATLRATSLRDYPETEADIFSRISPKGGSLASIIRSYKSVMTREILKTISHGFAWQARYDDHIIRIEDNLEKLREYIRQIPANWESIRPKAVAYA